MATRFLPHEPVVGPVFFYDLVRTARRGRQIGHRCFYLVLLVLFLLLVMWSHDWGLGALLTGIRLSLNAQAELAQTIFNAIMSMQFAVVYLITPLYTASAITEEKERRTLDLLFTTELSDREIILGTLAARLGNITLLLLAGLPFLSLLEFLGGVDPNAVLAGYLVTGLMMLSLGCISITVSVHCRTSLAAVVWSYVWALCFLPIYLPFFVAALRLPGGDGSVAGLAAVVAVLLTLFMHGIITMLCASMAIHDLRRRARPGNVSPSGQAVLPAPMPRPDLEPEMLRAPETMPAEDRSPLALTASRGGRPGRPPVSDHALLWKEMYAAPYIRPADPGVVHTWLSASSIVLLVLGIAALFNTSGEVAAFSHGLIRSVGTPVSCFLLLVVAVSAAQRVSRERERRTLDSLLLLPVSRDAILFAKWLGSILTVRWLAWALAGLLAIGLVSGGLSVAAVPLLIGGGLVAVTFVASLGLWFSTVCANTLRATLLTVLVALLGVLGPGALLHLAAVGVFYFQGVPSNWIGWTVLLADYGLSLPSALTTLAFQSEDLTSGADPLALPRILAAVAGLHVYLVLCVMLLWSARTRLRAEQGPAARRGIA
jgi:ABC-type transport system involved in multi-copper enzyme maturation permease subunit